MGGTWALRAGPAVIILRMEWPIEPSIRPLHAGASIFIGTWRCPGAPRPWTEERAPAWELELPVAGLHLRAAGGRRWVMDPATLAVHRPGTAYLMASPTDRPQRSTILRLAEGLAEILARRPAVGGRPLEAAAALMHARLLREQDPVALEEQGFALAGRILEGPPEPVPGPETAASVRLAGRLEEALSVHFRERLTLDRLAGLVGVSPFHACRAFQAVTGQTVHRRLLRLRLRAALHDLAGASGHLAGLALSLGFSSHSHFTSAFRREYGCLPGAWAQRP